MSIGMELGLNFFARNIAFSKGIIYLIMLENSMGCVLGQHDESGQKENEIYYLSKKFTCETRYSLLEKTCCALAWAARRLRQASIAEGLYELGAW